jgi:hypothetical protein
MHRHMAFALLAYFAPPYLRPDFNPHPGRPPINTRKLRECVRKLQGRGFEYRSYHGMAALLKQRFPDDFQKQTIGGIEKRLSRHLPLKK